MALRFYQRHSAMRPYSALRQLATELLLGQLLGLGVKLMSLLSSDQHVPLIACAAEYVDLVRTYVVRFFVL